MKNDSKIQLDFVHMEFERLKDDCSPEFIAWSILTEVMNHISIKHYETFLDIINNMKIDMQFRGK